MYEIPDRRDADVLQAADILLPHAFDGRHAVGHLQWSLGNPAAGLRLTGRLRWTFRGLRPWWRGRAGVGGQVSANMLYGEVGPLGTLNWSERAVQRDVVENLAKLGRSAFQERVQTPDNRAVVKAPSPLLAQYVVQGQGGAF